MITDDEKWHYLALKSLPEFDGKEWNYHVLKRLPQFDRREWRFFPSRSVAALLRGITSNHSGDFYCLNYFPLYSTKSTLKKHVMIMIIVA